MPAMAEPSNRRVADLAWSNRDRINSGRPPFARTVETRSVSTPESPVETWRLVECPYCAALHIHVNKRHGTSIPAPCELGEVSYVIIDEVRY